MKFPVTTILLCISASFHAAYGCKCLYRGKNLIEVTKVACRIVDGTFKDGDTGKRADRSLSALEQQAFLDGDDNRDFEYDLPYERKFRRPLSWAEDRKNVIAFLSPRGDRVPGRCKATGRPRRSCYRVDPLWRLVNTLEIQNRNNNDDQIEQHTQKSDSRALKEQLRSREARRQGAMTSTLCIHYLSDHSPEVPDPPKFAASFDKEKDKRIQLWKSTERQGV
ncbi:hypothetical protein V8E54_007736 [Elaphomyces granulatus]